MPKRNGFFWFMLEHRKRLEAKGKRFDSLKDVAPLASKIWEKMDAKKRARYTQQVEKKRPGTKEPHHKTQVPEKPDHTKATKTAGQVIKEEKLNELGKRMDLMVAKLKERLWQAEMDDTIGQQDFYLITMHYFCRTDDGVYIPAEVGMVKFNLECGVREQLHVLINPGKLPYGSALEAEQHSSNTHALPLPPRAIGETDFEGIALKVLSFLGPETDDSLPMLFTDAESVPVVESMLRRMLGDRIGQRTLYVCPVAELLFRVKLAVEHHMMSMTLFGPLEIAQQIIDSNPYAYTSKISCEYHESRDLLDHCALAQCIRWAYVISKNCCKELAIDLIPGKHVPIDTFFDSIVQPLPDSCDDVALLDMNLDRFTDATVDEPEPSCSGRQWQRNAPPPPPKPALDLFEMLEQQRKGEGNVKRVSLREPQVLDDDEIRRGVVIKLKESESWNIRGPARGRGRPLIDGYLDPAVMGRGYADSHRRGGVHQPSRGRGSDSTIPVRNRGK